MIIDDREVADFLSSRLQDIRNYNTSIYTEPCPHCKLLIQRPIIARKQDIEDFRRLLSIAYEVMGECGITGNLLASIKAKCYIKLAEQASKEAKK